ncbi:hypothetical protein ACJX0J_018542, partial [Zea mays]
NYFSEQISYTTIYEYIKVMLNKFGLSYIFSLMISFHLNNFIINNLIVLHKVHFYVIYGFHWY